MLFSHLRLGLLGCVFLNTMFTYLISHDPCESSHLTLLNATNTAKVSEEYKV